MTEQLLTAMKLEQDKLNNEFREMEVVRETISYELTPIVKNLEGVSRTEIFLDGGKVILKRFIDGKLVRVEFGSLGLEELVKWMEVKDTIFVKCMAR